MHWTGSKVLQVCPTFYHSLIFFTVQFFRKLHIFSFKASKAAEDVRGTSPLILPSAIEPLHAQKHQNITLKCLSDAPIQWLLSENQEKMDHRTTQFELNDQNIYETHLDLFNVTHKSLGFYYCIKNSSANSNLQTQFQNHLASKIYVFVSGAVVFTHMQTKSQIL